MTHQDIEYILDHFKKQNVIIYWQYQNNIFQLSRYGGSELFLSPEQIETYIKLQLGMASIIDNSTRRLINSIDHIIIDTTLSKKEIEPLLNKLINYSIWQDRNFYQNNPKFYGRDEYKFETPLSKITFDKYTNVVHLQFQNGQIEPCEYPEVSWIIYLSYYNNSLNLYHIFDNIDLEKCKCTCGALKLNPNANEYDHSRWCDIFKK